MRCPCGQTIPDREILAEAGRIRARMRKTHRGPLKLHECPRCGEKILGLALLTSHLATCPAPALGEITPEDLAALAWTPEDAA
jgi:hypothetical protein